MVGAQTSIVVETTEQHSTSQCTLSDAINAVNTNLPFRACPTGLGVTEIQVPAGEYVLNTYAVDEFGELTGLPYVTATIRIVGAGSGATTIRRDSNAPAFRLFKFQAPFLIEGMTLSDGVANHPRGGGAILAETFNSNARMQAVVRDVVFSGNQASFGGALADTGFFFGPYVQFTIEGSTFTGNRASQGGGAIHLSPNSSLNASHSHFENNIASAWGGAIYTPDAANSPMTIADSEFLGNHSDQTGGAIQATSPTLNHVTFASNTAEQRGGALYSYGGRPIITESTFAGNAARRGGAVEIAAGSVEIHRSTFSGNRASQFEGGALRLDDRTRTSRITNSTFSANFSSERGAISLAEGAVTIINSTVTGDRNTPPVPGGMGITAGFSGTSEVFLSNSIVAGNRLGADAVDLYFDPNSGGDRIVSLGHNLIGSNQYVQDVFTAIGDQTGTMASPLDAGLVDLADNGGSTPPHTLTHALTATSPAIDAGSPAAPGTDDACLPVDQRGEPRSGPGSARCDIGAFERNGTVAPGGPTTTAVMSSPNPSTAGAAVTFTAIVTREPGSVGTPSGTVTFLETTTSTTLGSAAIDGTGAASLTTSALPAGLWTIQAGYAGDGLFSGSVGTTSQTVVALPATTMTTLVSSANPSMSGAPVTFTATVTGGAGGATPVGSVSLVYVPTSTILGSIPLDATGAGSFTTNALFEGTFTVRADYAPAGPFLPSSQSIAQVVQPSPDTAIRNGTPEGRPQFGGVGAILSGPGREPCTGTMVSDFVVLTAAHCLRNAPLEAVSFSLGAGRTARASGVRTHPGFDTGPFSGFNLAFDIALVLLDRNEAGSWTDVVRPAIGSTNPTIGVEATAVGFGPARTSGVMLVNDLISAGGSSGEPLPSAFIEAQPANADNQMFCPAGVGGPLFHQGTIAGIASFRYVETCAEAGPGYYLTTARLAAWIASSIAELERPARRLVLNVAGEGQVDVQYDLGGLGTLASCQAGDSPCEYLLPEGTQVSLTASPYGAESRFVEWQNCPAASGVSCALTLAADRAINAVFENIHQLQVTLDGQGTVRVQRSGSAPELCSAGSSCVYSIPGGSEVTLDAIPLNGRHQFAGWSGCPSPSGARCAIPSMFGEQLLTARFTAVPGQPPLARIELETPGVQSASASLSPVTMFGDASGDPEGGAITYHWTAGSQSGAGPSFTALLPVGDTLVTLLVTDEGGSTGTISRTVQVRDTTRPALTIRIDYSPAITSGLIWDIPDGAATAVDAVDGVVPVLCRREPLHLGINSVVCEARDRSGNVARRLFKVTVRFPLLSQRAGELQAATHQTSGATAAMKHIADKLVTAALGTRICGGLSSYHKRVDSALSRGYITPAAAEGLRAIANEMIAMTGCDVR